MYKIYTKKRCVPKKRASKIFLIMRLTFAILLLALMQVSATSLAQKITMSKSNSTLKSVLADLNKQSNYNFLYTDELLQHAKSVDINVKNVDFKDVLERLFKEQPLTYTIEDRTVVIKEKGYLQRFKDNIAGLMKKPSLVTGIVTDAHGEALNGATVIIKRTHKGVNTDIHGTYVLTTAETNDTLLVSFIGYKTAVIAINSRLIINIGLSETTNPLDEIVVQAYGQTTTRANTGNISHITKEDIEKQPVMDPLLTLQGRVPGLSILRQNGYEGAPALVEIRGRNSINTNFSSDPLYIIDGVPQSSLNVMANPILSPVQNIANSNSVTSRGLDQTGMSFAGGQNPLFSLNPSDIESVDVLKDADATAIYGSRGANGVIIITTKKGIAGADQVHVGVTQGIQAVTRYWKMLNTDQYVAMRKEAFANDKITPTASNAADILLGDNSRYTDWQKYVYGNTGTWTNVQASLSGGSPQTTYRLSGGYNGSKSITTLSGQNLRASLESNLSVHSKNQKFNLSFTTNYSYTLLNQVAIPGVATLAPNAPDLFDAAGNLNFARYRTAGLSYPAAQVINPYSSKTNYLTSNINFNYNIIKGLVFRLNLGYNTSTNNQEQFQYLASIDPTAANRQGSANYGTSNNLNWLVEPQVEYNRLIGKGSLDVLFGGTDQYNSSRALLTNGGGYKTDALIHSITNATTIRSTDAFGQYRYIGFFGRINYAWDNKYIVNLNGRRDGSSRFGPGNQFGNFGSVGLAWLASEEKWLRNALPKAISFVKFRGSYGITGSDGVTDYAYLSQWGNSSPPLGDYNKNIALSAQILDNADFHWQVNKKLEGALDLAFFEDRVSVEAAYYRNRCDNQLIAYPLSEITGFNSVVANSGAAVQNSGWEFQANAQIIKGKSFSWNSNFNISFNNNILLAYPNIQFAPPYYLTRFKVGASLDDIYVYHYDGVDPQTGHYKYTDYNHDGKVTASESVPRGTGNDDRYYVISTKPKYSGGMNQQFTYKNLSLTAFFTFVKQIGQSALASNNGVSNFNISLDQYNNRWTTPGQTNATVAKLTTNPVSLNGTAGDNSFTESSGSYVDASYIRLQTVALQYSLPKAWAAKIKMSNLSLNANAQNIFVITPYKGLDPEVRNFPGMPPTRTITLGLSANL